MDISVEEIKRFLEEFCISADELVLNKMKELCFVYQCGEEHIVDQYVAYSTSKKIPQSPTIDLLNQMEREVLMKPKNTKHQKYNSPVCSPMYNASTIDSKCNKNYQNTKHNETYSPAASKSVLFSPPSLTPRGTPSEKYVSRTGRGDVACSFGDSACSWTFPDDFRGTVRAHDGGTELRSGYRFMHEKLRDAAAVLNDTIQEAAERLARDNGVEEWGHIHLPSLENVPVVGRVCSDGGRLSATSLFLEGSQELASGSVVPLDVSRLDHFSFFPGQIIAGTGMNNLGKKLVMQDLYKASYPVPSLQSPDLTHYLDSFGVVVAAGPFSTSDNLSYDPLWDLMSYVNTHKPHVVILVGPFVDVKNHLIENEEINETYDAIFEGLVTKILEHANNLSTKFVLVSSSRDAHHDNVYPTPPYVIGSSPKNLYLASDPCLLNIEGVIFGITATDIIFHLGKEEISHPQQPDRLGRLCDHLLTQKNFYPLYPPDPGMNVDSLRFELHAALPVMPHVLVVPSDFRCFIKDVNGCCCVNPERLAKKTSGGTFARLRIGRADEGSMIQAQVVRI